VGSGSKVMSLTDAVAQVEAGDAVHLVCGHSRWTAAGRELVRQWWGRDPHFTLVMLSLSSLGALFFRGGLVDRVITGYSGDVFPNFTPNPHFSKAYLSGEVEVEHWSFLAFLQRLEAAARGLPAITTTSIAGSSMADNPGFAEVDTPFGRVGLLEPYAPDVALVHGAVADRAGNVAFHPPLLEGVWGALAARRGAIVTVEQIVDDIRPWSHLVKIPAHQTLAVVECPMGAHPGGFYGSFTPAEPYAEDLDFWIEARDATRSDDYDDWIEKWVLGPADHDEYLQLLGHDRVDSLRSRSAPDSWIDDQRDHPPDLDAPVNDWERAGVFGARILADRIVDTECDAVLAGAGVANLATWLGVELARERGSAALMTAELGLWGYEPTPADPFIFNHRAFPSASMLADSSEILGMIVPGPHTKTVACLGAAVIDAFGNIDSTVIPGAAFLVGSGGGNDVASTADEVVVMCTLTPRRTVERVPYVTSPGDRVSRLVTDRGVFSKGDTGRFELVAIPAGDESLDDRVEALRAACGFEFVLADELTELVEPSASEVESLRRWDPRGFFLRP
jgi:acyl CoA:acetate/3-ketoacid CoA transferase alpha subunit/acyl CoA:acetate/3-ketoacid CoA transferase beta subunit